MWSKFRKKVSKHRKSDPAINYGSDQDDSDALEENSGVLLESPNGINKSLAICMTKDGEPCACNSGRALPAEIMRSISQESDHQGTGDKSRSNQEGKDSPYDKKSGKDGQSQKIVNYCFSGADHKKGNTPTNNKKDGKNCVKEGTKIEKRSSSLGRNMKKNKHDSKEMNLRRGNSEEGILDSGKDKGNATTPRGRNAQGRNKNIASKPIDIKPSKNSAFSRVGVADKPKSVRPSIIEPPQPLGSSLKSGTNSIPEGDKSHLQSLSSSSSKGASVTSEEGAESGYATQDDVQDGGLSRSMSSSHADPEHSGSLEKYKCRLSRESTGEEDVFQNPDSYGDKMNVISEIPRGSSIDGAVDCKDLISFRMPYSSTTPSFSTFAPLPTKAKSDTNTQNVGLNPSDNNNRSGNLNIVVAEVHAENSQHSPAARTNELDSNNTVGLNKKNSSSAVNFKPAGPPPPLMIRRPQTGIKPPAPDPSMDLDAVTNDKCSNNNKKNQEINQQNKSDIQNIAGVLNRDKSKGKQLDVNQNPSSEIVNEVRKETLDNEKITKAGKSSGKSALIQDNASCPGTKMAARPDLLQPCPSIGSGSSSKESYVTCTPPARDGRREEHLGREKSPGTDKRGQHQRNDFSKSSKGQSSKTNKQGSAGVKSGSSVKPALGKYGPEDSSKERNDNEKVSGQNQQQEGGMSQPPLKTDGFSRDPPTLLIRGKVATACMHGSSRDSGGDIGPRHQQQQPRKDGSVSDSDSEGLTVAECLPPPPSSLLVSEDETDSLILDIEESNTDDEILRTVDKEILPPVPSRNYGTLPGTKPQSTERQRSSSSSSGGSASGSSMPGKGTSGVSNIEAILEAKNEQKQKAKDPDGPILAKKVVEDPPVKDNPDEITEEPEPIHMTWAEVMNEAKQLGIPLNVPAAETAAMESPTSSSCSCGEDVIDGELRRCSLSSSSGDSSVTPTASPKHQRCTLIKRSQSECKKRSPFKEKFRLPNFFSKKPGKCDARSTMTLPPPEKRPSAMYSRSISVGSPVSTKSGGSQAGSPVSACGSLPRDSSAYLSAGAPVCMCPSPIVQRMTQSMYNPYHHYTYQHRSPHHSLNVSVNVSVVSSGTSGPTSPSAQQTDISLLGQSTDNLGSSSRSLLSQHSMSSHSLSQQSSASGHSYHSAHSIASATLAGKFKILIPIYRLRYTVKPALYLEKSLF